MVFYLKLNEDSQPTYRNFKRWLEILGKIEGACPVVICDKPEILTKLVSFNLVIPGMRFISSERTAEELVFICDRITNQRWRYAGFAHLTAFWDAYQQGYDEFWNIDADDTLFGLSVERTAQLLQAVVEDANKKEIDIYSLDMHTTRTNGVHWSFGITYTNNRVDWLREMREWSQEQGWKNLKHVLENTNNLINIDMFFTYISRASKTLRFGTFYSENLRFIHYAFDFLGCSAYSGLYYWKEGRLYSPILKDVLRIESFAGGEEIPEEVINIDIGITEDESVNALQECLLRVQGVDIDYHPSSKGEFPWKEINDAIFAACGNRE